MKTLLDGPYGFCTGTRLVCLVLSKMAVNEETFVLDFVENVRNILHQFLYSEN